MGDRVRVIHDGDGRLVAAKSPPPDDPGRAAREATVLSGVRHPGVVELLELAEGDRGPEVVTRWVGSRTAADLPQPLDPARAAGLVLAVAATIEDLHHLGVVHGGLDATHVLLDPQGRPVLCSFGDATLPTTSAPRDDGIAEVRPSVDVAGLGSLLLDLLGGGDTPPSRWSRTPGPANRRIDAQRRALLAIARQAVTDDPTCRPGVRAFADAVRAAAPDATLGLRPADPRPAATVCSRDQWPDSPARPDPIPTTDPLLALLADTADTADKLPTLDDEAPSIDAPRVVDTEPERGVYHELDRLRPSAEAMGDPTRPLRGRLGGVSLVLGLGVLGFLGVSALTGDATPVTATATSPPRQQPVAAPTTLGATTGLPGATTPTTDPLEPSTSSPPAAVAAELEHLGVRYRVGQPGDLVTVGDWRCTGAPTPALYRPSTGSLFVFPDWPAVGDRAEVTPVLTATGGGRLEAGPPDDGGCPTLLLHHRDGRVDVIDRETLS